MDAKLQKFVDTAEEEVGYTEKSDGTTKYGEWYGLPTGAWCAMFISWCANEAGLLTTSNTADPPYFKKASTVSSMVSFFTNNRRDLAPSSNPYNPNYPKPGDLAVIDNQAGTRAHIGIVVSTDGNKITTVEGNYDNKVSKNTYTDLVCGRATISMILSNNTSY